MEHTITTTERTRTTRPRTAGTARVSTEQTAVSCSCGHADTITWSGPLVARLARTGETREQYIARVARMHVGR